MEPGSEAFDGSFADQYAQDRLIGWGCSAGKVRRWNGFLGA
jgi:hypothetical protein